MQKISIQSFDSSDLIEILKIESSVFKENSFDSNYLISLIKNNRYLYTAKTNGKPIGYILGGKYMEKEAKIISIAVKPQYQNRGVGSKLVTKFLKEAERDEHEFVSLEVRENKENVICFYKKFGFKEKKKLENYYNDGENAIYMTKKMN